MQLSYGTSRSAHVNLQLSIDVLSFAFLLFNALSRPRKESQHLLYILLKDGILFFGVNSEYLSDIYDEKLTTIYYEVVTWCGYLFRTDTIRI